MIMYDDMKTIPAEREDDLETPDLFFYLFDQWAVLDVETETAYFMTLPDRGLGS